MLILSCDKCGKRMGGLEEHSIVNDQYVCVRCVPKSNSIELTYNNNKIYSGCKPKFCYAEVINTLRLKGYEFVVSAETARGFMTDIFFNSFTGQFLRVFDDLSWGVYKTGDPGDAKLLQHGNDF